MPTTTRSQTISFINLVTTTNVNGSSVSMSSHKTTFESTKSGGGQARWRELIQRGENATTAFTGTVSSLGETKSGSFKLVEVWSATGALQQEIVAVGVPPNIELGGTQSNAPTADNLALKYLYRAIGDQRTSFQGGVFLGEMRESLRMIMSPAKALRQGFNDYLSTAKKRGRTGSRKSKTKMLAETWLEYSFGWVPLASDIVGAAEAYVKHKEKILTNRITRLGNEESTTFHQVNAPGSNFGGVPTVVDKVSTTKTSVMYRVGIRYAGSGASPSISTLERFGLVTSQFVPTLWELLPYSFLVDYFTNIGDIIAAGATNTSDVIWVNKTIRSVNSLRQYIRPDVQASFDNGVTRRTISGTPGSYDTSKKTVIRSIPVLGFPSFSVSIPGRPTQWLNMAALAAGARNVSRSLL